MSNNTLESVVANARKFYAEKYPETHAVKDSYCPFYELAKTGLQNTHGSFWRAAGAVWLTVMRTGWDAIDQRILWNTWHGFQFVAPVHQTRVDISSFAAASEKRLADIKPGSKKAEQIEKEVTRELAAELRRIVMAGWGDYCTAPEKAGDKESDRRAKNRYVWVGGLEMISNAKLDWDGLYRLLADGRVAVLHGEADILECLASRYEKAAMNEVQETMAVTAKMRAVQSIPRVKLAGDEYRKLANTIEPQDNMGGSFRLCPKTKKPQGWDEEQGEWRNLQFEVEA